jgi:predicted DNA-binding transcriptional regulator YafY
MEVMRASRLISILLLMQARGQLTADQLAAELDVSVRTIYRDVDALLAAGIPLYGEAGHRGGYRLVDGYRTRLTGLTAAEAEALFLSGLPGPAAELGLGAVLAAAQLKVRAALPAALAAEADRIATRFHLDAPGWYDPPSEAHFLTAVAGAVWRGRVLQVRYRRWKAPTDVDRRLAPYGLVLKAGRWYLVAAPADSAGSADGGPRTYRVDQILALAELDEGFTVPGDFDLAGYWAQATAGFLSGLHRGEAVIRLAPGASSRLPDAAARARAEAGVPGPDGWRRAVVPIESDDRACAQFLALGADVEVLGPARLRARMAAEAAAILARYDPGHPRPGQ